MRIFYDIAIRSYSKAVWLASFFNNKAKHFVTGRKNWQQYLKDKVDKNSTYIWIHCASLGEFEQGRPLIEKIKQETDYKILLTFFSPSGYTIRKDYPFADIVSYLPIDSKRNAKRFINITQPTIAIFVKYEFWYHYLNQLNKKNIPTYNISTIFRRHQVFFKRNPWSKWYRKMLNNFTFFFLQNQSSSLLLDKISIKNYNVVGDTRFDRVAEIAEKTIELPLIATFSKNHKVLIAGSTWQPDEELLIKYINNHSNHHYIIAPHEISEDHLRRIENALQLPSIRYSIAKESRQINQKVLIIDSIGLLSSIYQYGTIAYIGGGFGVGIHNILEAATFGLPVIFGTNYQKFQEAVDLIKLNGAFSVENFNQLSVRLNLLFEDENLREKSSDINKKYIVENRGATDKIFQSIIKK